jgi:peroxiredoxin Q/BCP
MQIRHRLVRVLIPGLLAALLLAAAGASAEPKVGEPAPDFSFVGEAGLQYRLADHLGKRGMVVAWFPKAFTSG